MFEFTHVFERSLGAGSDVVQKEMYTFKDKSDQSVTLRPEGTAGACVPCAAGGSTAAACAAPWGARRLCSCYRERRFVWEPASPQSILLRANVSVCCTCNGCTAHHAQELRKHYHTHTHNTHTHTDIHAQTYTVGITRARMQTHALMPTITPLTPCAAMSGHRRGGCGSLHNLVRRLRRVWLISGLCGRPCGPRRVQAWRCLGSRLRRQTWK